jgi:hypothetical protein
VGDKVKLLYAGERRAHCASHHHPRHRRRGPARGTGERKAGTPVRSLGSLTGTNSVRLTFLPECLPFP